MARPNLSAEPLDVEYKARFTESEMTAMRAQAVKNGMALSQIVRRGVDRELRALANPEAVPLTLRYIETAPCGEWADADVEQDATFEISPDLARLWSAIPGDLILHTRGTSMIGAGVPEEALLHMRPFGMRSPRNGQVCAILAVDRHGLAKGTVKHWEWGGNRNVELKDGDGKKFDVPAGTVEIIANAFWVGGVIGLPTL